MKTCLVGFFKKCLQKSDFLEKKERKKDVLIVQKHAEKQKKPYQTTPFVSVSKGCLAGIQEASTIVLFLVSWPCDSLWQALDFE